MIDLNFILIIILGSIISALPILCVKEYLSSSSFCFILFAILCYILTIFSYIYILTKNNIVSITYPLIKLLSSFFVIFLGVFYYKERLTNYQCVGLVLGIISLYLLFMDMPIKN